MGTVLKFPGVRRRKRRGKTPEGKSGSATIIILPSVRIERNTGQPYEPEPVHATGRRRPRA